ncbi:hypothetical protein M5J14_11570 [Lysinibacillus sp. OL1_EC]|uniref:hypothetical protein n=1 Tax=unclassified Lysinibacillus TaxID=2636778 RepID=UPI00103B6653|nr:MULTISPECIES: hypothetical protein [unclassified Lysinibacillus]MCM0625151.1 hypothetical protein [Lysinibacillus sp. OL1_EC]TBV87385.1 hypothetical protein EW028_12965 [Lysinibacillus sp. OL1]
MTKSDKRIKRNMTSIMLIVYLVSFMLAVYFSVNDYISASLWIGAVFIISLLVLFYTANSYFKTRLEDIEAKEEKELKLNFYDYLVYFIKELNSIFTTFLVTLIIMAFDFTNNLYIYIGTSLCVALLLLILFYLIEKNLCKDVYKFREIIDSKYNVANIVNILTGICTLFVFIADMQQLNAALIFCVLAIVYTYYVFYNFIYIKYPLKNKH